jgi:hypothetical protein
MGLDGTTIGTVGALVAFVLTLMVYGYLGKDAPFLHALYRVAAYLFVGVALGYGAIVAWHSVLSPRLLLRLEGGQWWYLAPLALCLLLLTRVKRSWRALGNVTLALLFGVGAALAVGGALAGTLLPQVQATFVSLNPAHYAGLAAQEGAPPLIYVSNAALVIIGTISTLLYFTFTAGTGDGRAADGPDRARRRLGRLLDGTVQVARGFGKVFLMFTLGALFAMTSLSYLAALADRIRFIIETVWKLLFAP